MWNGVTIILSLAVQLALAASQGVATSQLIVTLLLIALFAFGLIGASGRGDGGQPEEETRSGEREPLSDRVKSE